MASPASLAGPRAGNGLAAISSLVEGIEGISVVAVQDFSRSITNFFANKHVLPRNIEELSRRVASVVDRQSEGEQLFRDLAVDRVDVTIEWFVKKTIELSYLLEEGAKKRRRLPRQQIGHAIGDLAQQISDLAKALESYASIQRVARVRIACSRLEKAAVSWRRKRQS